MPGIENSLLVRCGPNWHTENQTFQRAGCRCKPSDGNRRRFGLGTAGPPGESRNGDDPQAFVSPATRGQKPVGLTKRTADFLPQAENLKLTYVSHQARKRIEVEA